MKAKFIRLDKLLFDKGFVKSRSQAQEYIAEGRISVNGVVAEKPAMQIPPDAGIKVDRPQKEWVSRGAYKLLKALDYFGINPEGKKCVDIGASTGGFTDVLLSRGASSVYAIDVGYGQLAWKLRNNPSVTVMERTNARYLTVDSIGGTPADLVVCDASFISLKLLLNTFEALIGEKGMIITLLKPQFEAGRENVGNGVITNPDIHCKIINDITDFAARNTGLSLLDKTFSPIRGPEGNIEFLLLLCKSSNTERAVKEIETSKLVKEAHELTEKGKHN